MVVVTKVMFVAVAAMTLQRGVNSSSCGGGNSCGAGDRHGDW